MTSEMVKFEFYFELINNNSYDKKIVAKVGKDITGKEKYEIMKKAVSQCNLAMEKGFFLEATTLIESLICNRLESRYSELIKGDVNMGRLVALCNNVIKHGEQDRELLEIGDEIILLAERRNTVVHQAAKIEKGKQKDWESFLKQAENTAEDGRELFDRYNAHLDKIRK